MERTTALIQRIHGGQPWAGPGGLRKLPVLMTPVLPAVSCDMMSSAAAL